MSLDQNLFTLQVTPSQTDSSIVDLADPAGNMFYRKQRLSGAVYATRVYDFVTRSLLVAATAPSVTSKVKIIELQNPSVPVELKAFGTFSVKWGFQWKDHQFEWKKEEECYIIRKPDPPVLVAIATRKEIASATSARFQQSAMIQILDYNLNRFDIDDRKGLEFVILTSLLIFLDVADAQKNQNSKTSSGANVVPIIGSGTIPNATKKPSWIDLSPFGGHSGMKVSSSPQTQMVPALGSVLTSRNTQPDDTRLRTQSSPGPHPSRAAPAESTVLHPPPMHPSVARHHNSELIPSSSSPSVTRRNPPTLAQAHESSVLKPYPPTPPLTPPVVHPARTHHPKDPRLVQLGARSANPTYIKDETNSVGSSKRGVESGVNLVARMQAMRSVIHEVTVFEEGEIDDYAKFCWRMLRDEAMSFITVRSGHSLQVQKVLEVVEATKRLRFQRGPYIELLQFVTYYPLPGGTTLLQRLEERAKLANLTPKEAKRLQKRKEKEEKKREAKLKAAAKRKEKGKARAVDTSGNGGIMDLEPEELQMPPKSVVVRLTKVEVQKLVATPSISQNMADSKTRSVPKAREWQNNKDMDKKTDAMDKVRNDSNERDSAQMTQVQDPRFLVQSADIPRKYATIDPSFLLKRNTNSTTHKNHERRFSAVVSANHSQRDTAMSTQSTVPNATIQGRKRSSDHGKLTHDRSKVVKASISQPILNPGSEPAKHSSMRPAYRESVSYPGASVLKISDDAGLTDLSPAPAPPLPPRRSQPDAIKDIGGQISQQIAGPSTSKSADRSGNDDQPPSYDELSVEEGYTSGMKEKKGRDKS